MSSPLVRKFALLIIAAIVLWLGLRYLLPIALPFVLAAAIALAAEPAVTVLCGRCHLPRWAATGIGVSVFLGLVALAAAGLGAIAVRQLRSLADAVPDLQQTARQGMDSLRLWLTELSGKAPKSIRPILENSAQELFADSSAFLGQLTGRLVSLADRVVSGLPDSALWLGTWLLASYMISAKLPAFRQWAASRLHAPPAEQLMQLLRRLKVSAAGWLKAQLKLMGITFLLLSAGFWLLRVGHSLFWAALICVMDALPVLGTGVVLVPWGIVCLLQGQAARGIGLLGLCAAAMLLRAILEPKLLGKQLGIDPLLTLAAMYTGYRLWGIGGMILSPLLAVSLVQIFSEPLRGRE